MTFPESTPLDPPSATSCLTPNMVFGPYLGSQMTMAHLRELAALCGWTNLCFRVGDPMDILVDVASEVAAVGAPTYLGFCLDRQMRLRGIWHG